MALNRAVSIACRHSDYVADWVARHPTLLDESCLMSLDRSRLDIDGRLLLSIEDETDFRQALRRLRHRQLIRIAVRDLAGLAGLEETLTDTSDVADALIRTAYGWSYERLRALWGTPIGRQSGQPQQMIVLTMGKLGGRELNFSSDVDLIFAYAENGETQGGPRQIDNGEFFIKLGRMMNAALTTVTDWGFVYRVDMRLRPFGTAGQLAQSFDALFGDRQFLIDLVDLRGRIRHQLVERIVEALFLLRQKLGAMVALDGIGSGARLRLGLILFLRFRVEGDEFLA